MKVTDRRAKLLASLPESGACWKFYKGKWSIDKNATAARLRKEASRLEAEAQRLREAAKILESGNE